MSSTQLKRTLNLSQMVFYGLGTIVGAGIYVLIGEIADLASAWTPFAFLCAAVIAGFTGLSYAELVTRYPRSAGEAVYVEHAFRQPWLSQLVGWLVVLTGLVSAATLSRGFAGYFISFSGGSENIVIIGLILIIGVLAIGGVKQSVNVAVAITLLELLGLLLIITAGSGNLFNANTWESWLTEIKTPVWSGFFAATFLAFYAFIGFEDMVNMAEEVEDVSSTLPKAIVLALVVATGIYGLVSLVIILTIPIDSLSHSQAPLVTISEQSTWLSPLLLNVISLIAIANGVIVQLLMIPRVIYGITQSSKRFSGLAKINAKTQTPINATLLAIGIILLFALLLPLKPLAQLTSGIILVLFIIINVALIVIKKQFAFTGFQVSLWVPIMGIITTALLLITQLI